MMTVEIARDTLVRIKKGTVIELPEAEAKRLIALGNAVEKKPEQKTKKKG